MFINVTGRELSPSLLPVPVSSPGTRGCKLTTAIASCSSLSAALFKRVIRGEGILSFNLLCVHSPFRHQVPGLLRQREGRGKGAALPASLESALVMGAVLRPLCRDNHEGKA